jgi:DNA-binding MarR family transcriptional regulator
MLDKRSKDKLERIIERRKRNIARLIYITYRNFNEWAQVQWKKDGWGDIRPDHMRLISILGTEALNNNELAKRAKVTKQAMSKMVTLLEGHGFVDVHPDPSDSRSKIISISKNGVEFLDYLGNCAIGLEEKFNQIIGEKKTQQLISILSEFTEGVLEQEKHSIK